jgi:hypothetical protein
VRMKRAWTDEDLKQAVAESTSYRMVLRRLGLKDGSLRYLQTRIEESGLDTTHFANHRLITFGRMCPDEQLRELVRKSFTSTDVLRKLGLEETSYNFHRLRRRVALLRLDTSHFTRSAVLRDDRPTRWTDDDLRAAVRESCSYAETIRRIGLVPAGGNYDQIQRRIRELDIEAATASTGASRTPARRRKVDRQPPSEEAPLSRWPQGAEVRAMRLGRALTRWPHPGGTRSRQRRQERQPPREPAHPLSELSQPSADASRPQPEATQSYELGAQSGTRTRTPLRAVDLKSTMSASSIIRALLHQS